MFDGFAPTIPIAASIGAAFLGGLGLGIFVVLCFFEVKRVPASAKLGANSKRLRHHAHPAPRRVSRGTSTAVTT